MMRVIGRLLIIILFVIQNKATSETVNFVKIHTVPGVIQAEDFNGGEPGVDYHDTTKGNTRKQYRMDTDVDTIAMRDSDGYYVGMIKAGEWVKYTIDVKEVGVYETSMRVASIHKDTLKKIEIRDSEGNSLNEFTFPATGGWRNWTIVQGAYYTKFDEVGVYKIQIYFHHGSLNLDYIEFKKVDPTQASSSS